MNKKMMLLLTGFIAVSPVLQVSASTDAMFYDIKNIVEDKLTGQNDYERLHNVQYALQQVKMYKQDMQNQIIAEHASNKKKNFAVAVGALGTIFGGFGAYIYSLGQIVEGQFCGAAALAYTGIALTAWCEKNVSLYFMRKKINEFNNVILRLEAMEKALIQKLYPCSYCGY